MLFFYSPYMFAHAISAQFYALTVLKLFLALAKKKEIYVSYPLIDGVFFFNRMRHKITFFSSNKNTVCVCRFYFMLGNYHNL